MCKCCLPGVGGSDDAIGQIVKVLKYRNTVKIVVFCFCCCFLVALMSIFGIGIIYLIDQNDDEAKGTAILVTGLVCGLLCFLIYIIACIYTPPVRVQLRTAKFHISVLNKKPGAKKTFQKVVMERGGTGDEIEQIKFVLKWAKYALECLIWGPFLMSLMLMFIFVVGLMDVIDEPLPAYVILLVGGVPLLLCACCIGLRCYCKKRKNAKAKRQEAHLGMSTVDMEKAPASPNRGKDASFKREDGASS